MLSLLWLLVTLIPINTDNDQHGYPRPSQASALVSPTRSCRLPQANALGGGAGTAGAKTQPSEPGTAGKETARESEGRLAQGSHADTKISRTFVSDPSSPSRSAATTDPDDTDADVLGAGAADADADAAAQARIARLQQATIGREGSETDKITPLKTKHNRRLRSWRTVRRPRPHRPPPSRLPSLAALLPARLVFVVYIRAGTRHR
jgi:hypothetical protein